MSKDYLNRYISLIVDIQEVNLCVPLAPIIIHNNSFGIDTNNFTISINTKNSIAYISNLPRSTHVWN